MSSYCKRPGIVDISGCSPQNQLLKQAQVIALHLQFPRSVVPAAANDFQLATETPLRHSHLAFFPPILGRLRRKEPLASKDVLLFLSLFIGKRSTIEFRTSTMCPVTRRYMHANGSRCLNCNNPPTHGTRSRKLPPRWSELCQFCNNDYSFCVTAALLIIYLCFQSHSFQAENVEPLMALLTRC